MESKKEKFAILSNIVIDKLEGGYYHPNMKLRNPKKFAKMGNSGETMYGIDRVHGDKINKTPAGLKFWQIIDNANAKNIWPWLYMGGNLESELKKLVVEIIYPEFLKLEKRFLSKQAQELIQTDNRLFFHFVYATWNGSGWFQKFATDFSNKIASGETNINNLVKYLNDLRTKEGLRRGSPPNSLIKQGGEKIKQFLESLQNSEIVQTATKGAPLILILLLTIYLFKTKFNYA